MPGTLVANPHTYKPWVAGDIVYLKPWSEQTRVAYEEAGVQEKAADHPAVVLFRSDPRSKYVVVAIMTSMKGKLLSEHVYANSSAANLRCYVPIRPSLENEECPLWLTMTPHPCLKKSFINLASIHCIADGNLGTFRDKTWDKAHDKPYALCEESTNELLEFVKTDAQVSVDFEAAQRKAMVHTILGPQMTVPSASVPTAQNQSHGLTDQPTLDSYSRLAFARRSPSLADHLTPGARVPFPSNVNVPAASAYTLTASERTSLLSQSEHLVPRPRVPLPSNVNVPAARVRTWTASERTRLLRQSQDPPEPSRPSAKALLGLLVLLVGGAAAVCGVVWLVEKAWWFATTHLTPAAIWAGMKNLASWLGQHTWSTMKGLGSWLWGLIIHERGSI